MKCLRESDAFCHAMTAHGDEFTLCDKMSAEIKKRCVYSKNAPIQQYK